MAQNEMKAMRGMPLRVPSMEGLGRVYGQKQPWTLLPGQPPCEYRG